MESDKILKVQSNIFELQQHDLNSLKLLMNQSCVFNNAKDPWDPEFAVENPINLGNPIWLT
jgi:hypothetical protein